VYLTTAMGEKMNRIKINKIDNRQVKVFYDNNKIILPKSYKEKVEKHWNTLIDDGREFTRGDVYTITKVEYVQDKINIFVRLTDYAHFLYTYYNNDYSEYACKVIYASALIETSDNKFVFGEMDKHTASPGKLQFSGGGMDKGDIEGNLIDLNHNIRREIFEETGLDLTNEKLILDFKPKYLKSGGKSGFLSVIFKVKLLINEDELRNVFINHNKDLILQGIKPEFKSLIFLEASKEKIIEFKSRDLREKDENFMAALEAETGAREVDI
jgi:8-oxo-dGTP pyrophosphatase MutT (NUDIX family)